jgi:DNA-binding NtrC family response regulator
MPPPESQAVGTPWATHWIEDARASLPEAPPQERPACAARLAAMLFACGKDEEGDLVLSAARREAARADDHPGMARIEIALADGAVARDDDAGAHGHLAAARRQLRPVPPSIAARAWIVEARLARAEGRPAPPGKAEDPDATQEELLDPSERLDLGAELSLERAIAARLARDWAGARTQLERAHELASSLSSPRLIALAEIEIGLYTFEVDDPAAAAERVQHGVFLLRDAGLQRDAGRAMIRLAEMIVAKGVESEDDPAAAWLAQAQAALGGFATWRDRSKVRGGFRARGRRLFDRAITEETSTQIEGFERARGALLSAIAGSVEAAECALNELEAAALRGEAPGPLPSLIDQARAATLSTSQALSPSVAEVDRVVRGLIDLIGAALVERGKLRDLVHALADVDVATDPSALPTVLAEVTAQILAADHVVVALAKDGELEAAGRWGEPAHGSADLWKTAASAVSGERAERTSNPPASQRGGGRTAGPVLVLPLRGSGVDGAIYADKLTREGQFQEQDHALALLLAEYGATALGRLRDRAARRQKAGILEQPPPALRPSTRPRYAFQDLLGTSPALLRAVTIAKQAAAMDSCVLLTGETGTGKEIIAQAIHGAGARAGEPFLALNVAALSSEALETELFGYEAGAFAGARSEGSAGKLELAAGGTVLLDEIGEMPLGAQAKLLRVLQGRVVVRLGGTVERPVRARLMATTRRDLGRLVDEEKFRTDLLYRLRAMSIELPPLRERREDIPPLVQHYLARFAEQQRKRIGEIAPSVMEELTRYDWPGNVREVANVIESEVNNLPPDATALLRLTTRLALRLRPPPSSATKELRASAPTIDEFPPSEAGSFSPLSPILPLIELEKKAYLHALEKCNHNVARAAEALGVSKVTFYTKLRSWGMHPRDRFDDEGPTSVRRQRGSGPDPFEPPTRTSSTKMRGGSGESSGK